MATKGTLPPRLDTTRHPLVYEVNTRVLLQELTLEADRKITLGTIPDKVLDEWAGLGFDAVWLMGIWTTGALGRDIAMEHAGLQSDYRSVLSDLVDDDVLGSPYAVKAYAVSPLLGGAEGLKRLRMRMAKKGLGVILDYVGNHTARDHRWIASNPDLFVNGTPDQVEANPDRYFRTETSAGPRDIAYGRDPSFPGWTDTAQLNYFNPELRKRMMRVLGKIADQCDGVRCDMAMLTLNSVFERTWGTSILSEGGSVPETEFWSEAMTKVRESHPRFLFIAEAYWNMGWDLQNLGFDYTYDKRLYDRLLHEGAASVHDHLTADLKFQLKSVRFIENHDEQRAAEALPSPLWHCAAATIMSTIPGMALFHEGQLDGRVVKLPVQLGRRPAENPSPMIECFYEKLLECVRSSVFREGEWSLLQARPAWHENGTWQNFISSWWDGGPRGTRFVVVNYSPHSGQCYIPLPVDPAKGALEFRDLMGPAIYYREPAGVAGKGMFFDLPGYALHIFDVIWGR
ncbi:MAG: alpha-amylase family glycosyl hydrolase [Ignavibacteria bacterium]|nr:alpha-amylase family glycosyl hydrolase [Ignavibacteria bacterium]